MIKFNDLKSLSQVRKIDGVLPSEGTFTFCSDSREFKNSDVFFAIPGQKINPVTLCSFLRERGLRYIVLEDTRENFELLKDMSIVKIWVNSTVSCIQELASLFLNKWVQAGNKVISISGSNGKTTTKEMLYHVLDSVFPGQVEATKKNNNNHLGVPFTIFQVTEQTRILILELGSNHPGEIKFLCNMIQPDIGVVTNIGATHLEFFGGLEQVSDEEGYLHHHMLENANSHKRVNFFKNMDDKFISHYTNVDKTISFGTSNLSDYVFKIDSLHKQSEISFQNEKVILNNTYITGEHNFWNISLAFVISHSLFPEKLKEIVLATSSFRPTKNRSEWLLKNSSHIFLDAYNANPSSMKVAIKGFVDEVLSLKQHGDKVCLILGDMNELGDSAPLFHQEIGSFAGSMLVDEVIFVGRYASTYQSGYLEGKVVTSTQELREKYWLNLLENYKWIFIKGSRSLQLESVLDIT